MSDYTEQYPRGNTALYMDRATSIKFKLMPDGVIRAHDSRYGCGVSEWHIITPPIYATQ